MNEPLISIAVCTYNGGKYIDEQLQSIVAQSYNNIEIIIVDDVSTDNTFALVTQWAEKDKRIKCYRNDVNLGFNKNFEKAISLTRGEYIAISDQDDVWFVDKLEQLLGHIGDNWLIFSNSAYVGEKEPGRLLKRASASISYKAFLLRNYVTGHTCLFSRGFLDFVLPFPEQGYYDWWMGFVAAYHHKLTYYDKVLTFYRIHEESVIQKQSEAGKATVEYENITRMLSAFSNYKNIEPRDRTFIKELEEAYRLKSSISRSVPLARIVHKHYNELFPYRKSLIKLFFAFKYSKGLR